MNLHWARTLPVMLTGAKLWLKIDPDRRLHDAGRACRRHCAERCPGLSDHRRAGIARYPTCNTRAAKVYLGHGKGHRSRNMVEVGAVENVVHLPPTPVRTLVAKLDVLKERT